MVLRFVFLISVGLLLAAGIAMAQDDKLDKAAVTSAEEWLAVVDNGNYADSWEKAATFSKKSVTKEQWVKSLQSFRKPLGRLVSRKLQSTTLRKSLQGTPDGKYVVITFKTVFDKKKFVIETVSPVLDTDGKWHVTGYYIK
ncbi:MAG: DUF4019 domain-containing protein [Oryzomonas sp.]|jgi:hypothetical protein